MHKVARVKSVNRQLISLRRRTLKLSMAAESTEASFVGGLGYPRTLISGIIDLRTQVRRLLDVWEPLSEVELHVE